MQIYLLAANLFALAALLLGLSSVVRGDRREPLLPLFLLVICRSFGLIMALVAPAGDYAGAVLGALEVLSAFFIIWTLTGPVIPWPKLAWPAGSAAFLLAVLLLFPNWPVPVQIHILLVAVLGAPFILFSAEKVRWNHLAAPFVLALANFLSLLDLTGLAWLVNLLVYVLFITAIHWESIQIYRQLYHQRERAAEALVQEAVDLGRERQRWLEVSEIISATPNLSQSMEHIARSMAQITHADQSALFMLDTNVAGQARLVTLYNPTRPVHLVKKEEIVFSLDKCPPLREAIDRQQQLLLAHSNGSGLNKLYALWNEERAGPTLIQPLAVHGRPVGALMLGNPVSRRPIRDSDVRLCRTLAPQIATMVEHRRRYLDLEAEAEVVFKQTNGTIEPLSILEVISDGLVVSDTFGRVQLVNRAAERILGKPRAELLNQSIGTIYGAIDSAEAIEDLAVAFSRRNQPLPTFFESEERAIQGRLIPWRDEQGEWKGIIVLFRDVTREIKADKARNDFIAALSRELRAPLTAIKGYSDLMIQGAFDNYSPEQIRLQEIIQTSADRMAAVLNNAIQISAQNRRQVLPRFEEIDELTKIFDEALQAIIPLARLRELRLRRDIPVSLPPLMADPRHIRQILDNLLANACHFTPPGGQVTLRAWVEQERVRPMEERPCLLIAVIDNGIGIPRSEQKRIFDPFYQVKDRPVDAEIGMGMGLAVIKELVDLHNGRVWVESVVGEGSVFQVALPLMQD